MFTGLSLTQFDDTVIAGAVEGVVGMTLDGWGGNDVLTEVQASTAFMAVMAMT